MKQSIGSDFLALSKKGKNEWWRILLFVLALIALPTFASLMLNNIELPNFSDTESELTLDIAVEGLAFSIVLVGVFFAIKLIHKRSFSSLNGPDSFQTMEFLEGVAVWGLLVVIGSLFNLQGQWKYFIDNGLNSSLIYILPITLVAIGIQSYTEEIVFRGYLLQTLSIKIKNISLIVLISSILFGFLHAGDGLAPVIGITIESFLICYVVLKRNNIAFAAGVHLINNFFFVYILADRNSIENNDFLKFDPMEYSIFIGQLLLLYTYIRYKDFRTKEKLIIERELV
jgi:uncharacterized protein